MSAQVYTIPGLAGDYTDNQGNTLEATPTTQGIDGELVLIAAAVNTAQQTAVTVIVS